MHSGALIGSAFQVRTSAQRWSVTTDANTEPGDHTFGCLIHDYMQVTLRVR